MTMRMWVVCFAAIASPLCADERRWVDRSEEGWFWYEEHPEPPPEPEPEPAVQPSPVPPAPRPAPAEAPPEIRVASLPPPAFSTEWFQAELPKYRARAIDHPTPANVEAYLLLQKIALDKSSAFAEALQRVTLGNPLLDAVAERPLATYATQALDADAKRAQVSLIGSLVERTGLLFFYAADCPLCAAQAGVIELLARKYGFAVMAVSLDGSAVPEGRFGGIWRPDQGQAATLGVGDPPAVFLMRPPDEIAPLAQGALDISALEDRIVLAAHRMGWVTDEEVARTQPVRRTTRAVAPVELDPALLEDPAQLVQWLRGAMAEQGGAP